ncbi:MAG: hypothetical protein ABIV50_08135 [Opitutus sp.]
MNGTDLAKENPASVAFALPMGRSETISRRDIASLKPRGSSLMPPALDRTMTPGQLRDLITYLLTPKPEQKGVR